VKAALVLVPGLLCDQRLWQHQVENLGDLAEPVVADVTGSDTIDGLAHAVLGAAPDRFVLAGLSLGGYVALGIVRAAPERVMRLALQLCAGSLSETRKESSKQKSRGYWWSG